MKKILFVSSFLLFFHSSFIQAQENDTVSIKTEKTTYVFRKSTFSNLVYQITCLADLGYGTRPAYIKLWKEKLNWSKEDSIKIEEWKSIIEKNDTILFKKNDSSELNTVYIFNFPTATHLLDKIILEVKGKIKISDEDIAQCINYLKVSENTLALLVNFGEPKLNYKRIVF